MIGQSIEYLNVVNSTNTYIKNNYSNMANGHIVIAKHQTEGYGRMGRKWIDNSDGSLMFSLYLKVPF